MADVGEEQGERQVSGEFEEILLGQRLTNWWVYFLTCTPPTTSENRHGMRQVFTGTEDGGSFSA